MQVTINGMLLSRCVSGVELSILNLARTLASAGSEMYRVRVPADFRESLPTGERIQVVRSHVPGRYRPLRLLWEQFALPRILQKDGTDVLHAPAYLLPIRSTCPTVLTVYDAMALTHAHWCRAINRLNYRMLMPPSIRRANAIIVPSEFTARQLVSLFPEAGEKVRVIPLGVSEMFRADADERADEQVIRSHGIPSPYLLFVARHEPKKNLRALVEAFHLLKANDGIPHKLVLAGASGWGCRSAYRRIHELGLSGDVIRPGFIPNESLPALYRQADVFVFPSLYEGFGLPPLEAMACGTPVVCSKTGSLPEVVEDAALLVDPTRPPDIARGIFTVLEDRDTRTALSQLGRIHASTFSWEATAQRTDDVYREVAARTTE